MAALAAALAALILAGSARASAPAPFADWAAVVVAGDDHAAHSGVFTEAFDNARRDVAAALERNGFSHSNIGQFSVRPARYPGARPMRADVATFETALHRLAARATAGCLIYFTSHGSPGGLVLNDALMTPKRLAGLVDGACGRRPTVVVLSACFSGVFLPALAGPDRLVLTAARRDRASFGCGESDIYPYFDACFLEGLPGARDFLALAPRVRQCIARREGEERLLPPSEPQVSVGAAFRTYAAALAFPRR